MSGPDPAALGSDPSAEGSAAAAGDPAPVPARATADAPSADVAPAVSAALPGEHRGGFQRAPRDTKNFAHGSCCLFALLG